MLIAVVAGLGIAAPLLVKMAIDRALESEVTAVEQRRILWQIGGVYAAVLVVTAAVHYVQIMLLQTIGQNIMFDLRRQLFRHVVRQDLALFDRQPVGRLMTRLTSDIEALNELFTSGLVTVATDVLTLFAIMGVMIWLDWRLALLSFTVIPVLFLVAGFFRTPRAPGLPQDPRARGAHQFLPAGTHRRDLDRARLRSARTAGSIASTP